MAVYACSDFHGIKDLYIQICEYLQPEDKVYFLGDACDRGKDGFRIMKDILSNPKFIYIKGNHEIMFTDAIMEYFDGGYGEAISLHQWNGGYQTFADWHLSGEDGNIARRLLRLPAYTLYTNPKGDIIHLCHAGFTPGKRVRLPTQYNLVWDRDHFEDSWRGTENEFVVHGHTPIQSMRKDSNKKITEAYKYCNGHKIDIDPGSYSSRKTILFNLDTFESIIFEERT